MGGSTISSFTAARTVIAAGLALATVACEPTYRLYEITEAGDLRSDTTSSRAIEIGLAFGYPADAGGVARVVNRSRRSLLLDVANSQITLDGHAMRLLDGPELAFDHIGPDLRFSGYPVTPRDGILYPRLEPGATLEFPVPPLRLGRCATPPGAHCGRYAFDFIVEADGNRPQERYRRAVDAVAVPAEKVSAYRARYPPARQHTYLLRTSTGGEGSAATTVVLGIIVGVGVAVAAEGGE